MILFGILFNLFFESRLVIGEYRKFGFRCQRFAGNGLILVLRSTLFREKFIELTVFRRIVSINGLYTPLFKLRCVAELNLFVC